MIVARAKRVGKLFIHLFHTIFQMMYGAWKISALPHPVITIFGSARLKQDSLLAKDASLLGKRFLDNGISILTGGGLGIMQAAACATTRNTKAKSIGIRVRGLEPRPEGCMQSYFELEYFFARKWLLTEFSMGFIIFPGGFGTLDEMAGVLTLMQVKHLKKRPIVLIDTTFWQPFMDWLMNQAVAQGTILESELSYLFITDDLDQAYCYVLGKCEIL